MEVRREKNAQVLWREIQKLLPEVLERNQGRAILSLYGGSGAGKTWISKELAPNVFDGIDLGNTNFDEANNYDISDSLFKLLRVLLKNIGNKKRLPTYLAKHTKEITKNIAEYLNEKSDDTSAATTSMRNRLEEIQNSFVDNTIESQVINLQYIVELHKLLSTIKEIKQNGLIGHYSINEENELVFITYSYSVIDYVNAILGGEYVQNGETINAEWFGVPESVKLFL